MSTADVITQEVIRARLDGIVREMQAAVLRTGFSTIIRESHDFSAGITDRDGNVVGQYSPLPPHLGAYPECVKGVLRFYSFDEMEEGDCFLINHPYYSGCPHPNDMVVVMPVFHEGAVVAFCASMGHKSDIGGQSPGSRNTLARDVFGEGLQIMPVKFLSKRASRCARRTSSCGRTAARRSWSSATSARRPGALWSIGSTRLKHLMNEYGQETLVSAFEQIGLRTEARVRQQIRQWPDGVWEAEAFTDDIVDPNRKLRPARRRHQAGRLARPRLLRHRRPEPRPHQRAAAVHPRHGVLRRHRDDRPRCAEQLRARAGGRVPLPRGLGAVTRTFPTPVGFYSMTLSTVEDIVFEAFEPGRGTPRRRAQRKQRHGGDGHGGRRQALRAIRTDDVRQRRPSRRRRLDRHRPLLGRRGSKITSAGDTRVPSSMSRCSASNSCRTPGGRANTAAGSRCGASTSSSRPAATREAARSNLAPAHRSRRRDGRRRRRGHSQPPARTTSGATSASSLNVMLEEGDVVRRRDRQRGRRWRPFATRPRARRERPPERLHQHGHRHPGLRPGRGGCRGGPRAAGGVSVISLSPLGGKIN